MENENITQPLISVIVPIYKVEDYLCRCVNSILNQTYSNLEIILVDDGSPDNCGVICDEYALKDSRIKVIHKLNGGLSDARNAALDIMSGDYVFFVDSDDMVVPNAIISLYSRMFSDRSDIAISTNVISFSEVIKPQLAIENNHHITNNLQALVEIFNYNARWTAWGGLFKSYLFKTLRFPKGKIYEDISLIPKVILNANTVSFTDVAIYCYFERTDSIMRANRYEVKFDLYEVIAENIKYIKDNVQEEVAQSSICGGMLMELCSRVDFAENDVENNILFLKKSRKLLRDNLFLTLSSKDSGIKKKLYYTMLSFGLGKIVKTIYKLKNGK